MKIRSEKSLERRKAAWEAEQDLFVESVEKLHPIDEDDTSMNKRLQECISRLKGEQEQCIRLFYFEDKSYKEIAQYLKMEEKKVKSFIQNGKRNLKICLESQHVKTK